MKGNVRKNVPRYSLGIAAMAAAIHYMYMSWPHAFTIFFASAFLFLISLSDTIYTRIPNLANLALVLTALLYHFYSHGFPGLWFSVQGLLLGLALLIMPYILAGMGAGDVKAMAALGSLLGPGAIFQVFLFTAIIGGLFAVLYYVISCNLIKKSNEWLIAIQLFIINRDRLLLTTAHANEKLHFPYATSIAFGFFSYVQYGKLL